MPDLAELNLMVNSSQVGQATSKLNELDAAGKKVEKTQGGVAAASETLSNKLRGLIPHAIALTAAYGAMKLVLESIKEAADFEALESGMATLLKSTEKAKSLLADLKKFADTTPFELKGLADTAKKMLGLQFTAEEIIPTLKIVGDAASGLDSGTEGMEHMILALGQIRSRGKASAEEMNQLLASNVNGWKYLADAIGTDIPSAMKLAEAGMITGAGAVKAILAGMERDFGGGMEKAAKLTKGLWSTLMDELHNFMRGLGETLIEAFNIKGLIGDATEWIKFLGALILDLIRSLLNLETRFQSTGNIVKPLGEWVRKTYTEVKQGWAVLVEMIEKGWTYLKFGFGVVFDFVKFGALAVIDKIRGGIADLIDGLQTLLGSPKVKTFITSQLSGIVAMTSGFAEGRKTMESVEGTLGGTDAILNGLVKSLRQPIGNMTTADLATSYAGRVADRDKSLAQITEEQQKKYANAGKTGFMEDIANFFKGLPGMGELNEWKNTTNREIDEKAAAAAGGIGKANVTKLGKGELLHPSRESLDSGLEALREMNNELTLQANNALLTDDQVEKLNASYKMQKIIRDKFLNDDEKAKAEAASLVARYEQQQKRLQLLKDIREAADAAAKSITGAFEDFLVGAKNAKDAVKGLLMELERLAVRSLISKPLESFLSGFLANVGASILGVNTNTAGVQQGGTAQTIMAAQASKGSAFGNLFGNGFLIPFASGGLVNGPTMFPMWGGGTGLMGEAGPEAIMPLSRGSDGRLGVKAQGAATTVVKNNNVYMNISTPNVDSFRRSSRQLMADSKRMMGGNG